MFRHVVLTTLALAAAGTASALVFTPEDVQMDAPTGHYYDGRTDQVYHWDAATFTLTPASGVSAQGLYDIDVVPPGQRGSVTTQRIETCPTDKNYCIAYGYALVGANKVTIHRVHTDECYPAPIFHDTYNVTPFPVIREAGWESIAGGCCGTIHAAMYIQDRWADDDGMSWRSSFGCP